MIIDSSALVAIMTREAESRLFNDLIAASMSRAMSAPNLLETSMVLTRHFGNEAAPKFDAYVSLAGITILPFTPAHALAAREAFLRYGKGRHPAALNFGDCIAYATAKLAAMPLLFKGGDFALTDVEPAF